MPPLPKTPPLTSYQPLDTRRWQTKPPNYTRITHVDSRSYACVCTKYSLKNEKKKMRSNVYVRYKTGQIERVSAFCSNIDHLPDHQRWPCSSTTLVQQSITSHSHHVKLLHVPYQVPANNCIIRPKDCFDTFSFLATTNKTASSVDRKIRFELRNLLL